MSYSLEAVIGGGVAVERAAAACGGGSAVALEGGLSLLPLVDRVREGIDRRFPEAGTGAMGHWLREVSSAGRLAYVGAEFWGGQGAQWSLVEERGEILLSSDSIDAINLALRLLGVVAEEGKDEFDTVGLGRHRRTERWAGGQP
ncbi:MAG: hypothetical protein HUU15_03335 [Candidatus Brocadiae bacterium]|nr:hypothetical protein [Candidatus Brocadiia bacterium]